MIINLFEINYEDSTLCLNSTNKDIAVSGKTYYGSMAGFGEINYDMKEVMGEVEFHVKHSRISDYLIKYVTDATGTGRIELVIYEYNLDTTVKTQTFSGVADVFALTDMALSISFKSMLTFIEESGTKLVTSPSCPTWLYSTRCGIDKENWKVTGTINSISGNVVSDTEFGTKSDGWFKYGYIICENEYRMILNHVGSDITLITGFSPNIEVGDSYEAYAGCDKRYTTCNSIFGNKDNFFGTPYVPLHEQIYIGQKTKQGDVSTKK